MCLWFDLRINHQVIGRLSIQRLDNLDPENPADSVSRYVVRLDGEKAGEVPHRYGDGAWELVRRAVQLVPGGTATQPARPASRP